MSIPSQQQRLRDFAVDRDWQQFHTPKNLVMALSGEAGELLSLFQWLSPAEAAAIMDDPRRAQEVRHEVADVFGYLLRLADVLGISLDDALDEKMELNAKRYPVQASRGHARKYTGLEEDQ